MTCFLFDKEFLVAEMIKKLQKSTWWVQQLHNCCVSCNNEVNMLAWCNIVALVAIGAKYIVINATTRYDEITNQGTTRRQSRKGKTNIRNKGG